MNEPKSKNEKPKGERRLDPELLKKGFWCDLDQYDMLKRCSDKKDMTEWKEWRGKNPNKEVLLEGANFQSCHLRGVWLHEDPVNRFGKVYLADAIFRFGDLKGARLWRAHLENSDFCHTDLKGANLTLAHLEGADFSYTNLKNASLPFATVDGYTIFFFCRISRDTWFNGVDLSRARIEPEMKELLEHNIRRIKWERWYKEHPRLKWLVKLFWWISDYGLSTKRIIFSFFGLALIFANIYYHWGRIAPPGIVNNLFVDRNGIEVQWWLVPLRTLYFSIVTMTTLGFGDMYANAHSVWGHILLSVQVILGYVLLGALVTRFAVLFTAGGPAGRFANEQEKKGQGE